MASAEIMLPISVIQSKYLLEGSQEISRLASQHAVIKDAMGGLILPPIDPFKRLHILDCATSDGTWIQDVAETHPKFTFMGTDIDSKNFPKNPPQGTTYQTQDINKAWPKELENSFDLVHQRLALVGAGPKCKEAVHRLAALVKPGGFIQLIEADAAVPDNGPAMDDFIEMMREIFIDMGVEVTFSMDIIEWLHELGFETHDCLVNVKMGANNPDPHLAAEGVYSNFVAATGLTEVAKQLPASALSPSLTPDRLDALPEALKTELLERGGVFPLRVVWGRKPE